MTPVLRDYQASAIVLAREAVREERNCLVVSSVGSGKSICFAAMSRLAFDRGKRVLIVAHRRKLVKQASAHLRRVGLDDQRLLLSGESIGRLDAPVTIASIDTLLVTDALPDVDLIIVDEAHHIVTSKFVRLRALYPNAVLVGFTATPERADGKPLKPPFTRMVVVSQVRELVAQGFLVPTQVWAPKKSQQGLADNAAAAYVKMGEQRRAIVFCANVPHSMKTAEDLRAAGVSAEHVDGETEESERDAILARFASGETRVLCNVSLVGEGFDVPQCKCVVIARGCTSPVMWIQAVGRAMRPDDSGLKNALVLDLRGAVWTHGMPDADREFSLEGTPITTRERGDQIMQCRYCGHVFKPTNVCPFCSATLPLPKSPAVRRAEMQQVFDAHSPGERAAFLRRLEQIARTKKRKYGWVAAVYKSRYGVWPQRRTA